MNQAINKLVTMSLAICLLAGCEKPKSFETKISDGYIALNKGKYAEAEKLFLEVMKDAEGKYKKGDPVIGTCANYLATTYMMEGKYPSAVEMYQKTIELQESALGPQHPELAIILTNLGDTFTKMDDYADAEPPYKRALAIQEKVYGPKSREVAATRKQYNWILAQMRRTGQNMKTTKPSPSDKTPAKSKQKK